MIDLLDQAQGAGRATSWCITELALTTFFPRWYMTDQAEVDSWFEREMPNAATRPLFEKAARVQDRLLSSAMPSSRPTATTSTPRSWSTATAGSSASTARCTCPATPSSTPQRAFQHLEKRYFEPGDLGFPVWRTMGGIFGMCICNDRRWPETYRVMGLQGVELVVLGYNTPSVNSQKAERRPGAAHVPP